MLGQQNVVVIVDYTDNKHHPGPEPTEYVSSFVKGHAGQGGTESSGGRCAGHLGGRLCEVGPSPAQTMGTEVGNTLGSQHSSRGGCHTGAVTLTTSSGGINSGKTLFHTPMQKTPSLNLFRAKSSQLSSKAGYQTMSALDISGNGAKCNVAVDHIEKQLQLGYLQQKFGRVGSGNVNSHSVHQVSGMQPSVGGAHPAYHSGTEGNSGEWHPVGTEHSGGQPYSGSPGKSGAQPNFGGQQNSGGQPYSGAPGNLVLTQLWWSTEL